MTAGVRLPKLLFKRLLERILRARGYDLHIIGTPLRGFENFISLIKKRGFEPSVVIDIGVGHGTPWLYRAFPGSKFILFEALSVFENGIKSICKQYDAQYHICALGDEDGEVAFHVPQNEPTDSSLLTRADAQKKKVAGTENEPMKETKVALKRLDDFKLGNPPLIIKIDVEGAELGVLRGAIKTLKDTEIIICEIGVQKRYTGQAELSEVFSFMASQHFQLFDIVDMAATKGGALSYLDAVFIRQGSRLFDDG